MKLSTLIAMLGIISTSILFGAMAMIIYVEFPAEQDKLLKQRGWVLLENLRRQIEPKILIDDRLCVSEAIISAKLSDKDVEYVFVLDANRRPLVFAVSRSGTG